MSSKVTLTRKEKIYHFFYLFGLLLMGLVIFSIWYVHKNGSPFATADVLEIKLLNDKKEFVRRQNLVQPKIDTLFGQIAKVSSRDEFYSKKGDWQYHFAQLENAFTDLKGDRNSVKREEGYSKLLTFYRFYYQTKDDYFIVEENLEDAKQKLEDCRVARSN